MYNRVNNEYAELRMIVRGLVVEPAQSASVRGQPEATHALDDAVGWLLDNFDIRVGVAVGDPVIRSGRAANLAHALDNIARARRARERRLFVAVVDAVTSQLEGKNGAQRTR